MNRSFCSLVFEHFVMMLTCSVKVLYDNHKSFTKKKKKKGRAIINSSETSLDIFRMRFTLGSPSSTFRHDLFILRDYIRQVTTLQRRLIKTSYKKQEKKKRKRKRKRIKDKLIFCLWHLSNLINHLYSRSSLAPE